MAQTTLVLTHDRNIDIPFGKSEGLCHNPLEGHLLRANDADSSPNIPADPGCFGVYDLDGDPSVSIFTLSEVDFEGITGTSGQTSTDAHAGELEIVAYGSTTDRVYVFNNHDGATSPTQIPAAFELQWDPLAGASGEYVFTDFIALPAKEIVNPQCGVFGPDGTLYIGDANSGLSDSDVMDVYTLILDFKNGCTYSDTPLFTVENNTPPMDGTANAGTSKVYGVAYHNGDLHFIGYQGAGGGGVRFKRFVNVYNIATRRKVAYYNLNTTTGSGNRAESGKTRGITIIDGEVYTSVNPSGTSTNAIGIYTLPAARPIEHTRFIGRDYLEGYNLEQNVETESGGSVASAVGEMFTALAGETINCSKVMATGPDGAGETCHVELRNAVEYSPGKWRPTGPALYVGQELTLAARGSVNGGIFFRAEPVEAAEDFALTQGEDYIPIIYFTGPDGSGYINAQQLVARDPELPDVGEAATDDGTGGTPPTLWTSTDANFLATPTFGFGVVAEGEPTLSAAYDPRADSLGTAVSIPSNFSGATGYRAQDLPDGCSIDATTGRITGTVKTLIAGTPTVVAKNADGRVSAAIPWTAQDPGRSAVAVSGGAVTFDDVTIAADSAVYLSPFGLLTAAQNNRNIGTVDGSGSDLIINGTTVTSPAVLYLSPAGILTDQPNGDPVANFN